MTDYVAVNDGVMIWVANQQELRDALDALGWTRNGTPAGQS